MYLKIEGQGAAQRDVTASHLDADPGFPRAHLTILAMNPHPKGTVWGLSLSAVSGVAFPSCRGSSLWCHRGSAEVSQTDHESLADR